MHLLKKTKLLMLIYLALFSLNTQAQECSTPNVEPQEAMSLPWFGNPDYLPNFIDSVRTVDGIPSQYSRIVPNIK